MTAYKEQIIFLNNQPQIKALTDNLNWTKVNSQDDVFIFKNNENYFVKIKNTQNGILFLGIANSLDKILNIIPNDFLYFQIPETAITLDEIQAVQPQIQILNEKLFNLAYIKLALRLENIFNKYPELSSVILENDNPFGSDAYFFKPEINSEEIAFISNTFLRFKQDYIKSLGSIGETFDSDQFLQSIKDDYLNFSFDKINQDLSNILNDITYIQSFLPIIYEVGRISTGNFIEILSTIAPDQLVAKVEQSLLNKSIKKTAPLIDKKNLRI